MIEQVRIALNLRDADDGGASVMEANPHAGRPAKARTSRPIKRDGAAPCRKRLARVEIADRADPVHPTLAKRPTEPRAIFDGPSGRDGRIQREAAELALSGTIAIRVQLGFKAHRARKFIVMPEATGKDNCAAPEPPRADQTLIKALARAHRWKRILESGEYATIAELAGAENINRSYLCRVLRLTLLAPDIVDAILAGRHGKLLTLRAALEPFPAVWAEQEFSIEIPRRRAVREFNSGS